VRTIIFASAFVMLLTLSGAPMRNLILLGVAGLVGIVLAYFFYDVATTRIDAFLFGGEGGSDTYQTDSAIRTLTAGGLFGAGPGRGCANSTCRSRIPTISFGDRRGDSASSPVLPCDHLHGDRRPGADPPARRGGPVRRPRRRRPVTQFGLQALINMAVNVQLAPSKGMTLPFISYGGSSMIALAIGHGLLLALPAETRICAAPLMW
jgi:cell division protein FtsW